MALPLPTTAKRQPQKGRCLLKKFIINALIVLLFLFGLGLICYPTLSNWYNEQVGSYSIQTYQGAVDSTPYALYESLFASARSYNSTLTADLSSYVSGAAESTDYIDSLNLVNGMMGYLVIDEIAVNLPIYHGTDESVLQNAIGHLEGSALPTGNLGEHTVLTGHTGLPSATLLTNLTELALGDTFCVHVLNEIYTYQVYNIVVVEPTELDALAPVADKNLVTLVTCTPYGINSHRLFVQGELISVEVTTTDQTIDSTTDITDAVDTTSQSNLPPWLERIAFACAQTIAEGLRSITNWIATIIPS